MKPCLRFLLVLAFAILPSFALALEDSDGCGMDAELAFEEKFGPAEDMWGSHTDNNTFFEGIKGTYEVVKYGGTVPEKPTTGTVEVEAGMALFAMQYCPPGGGCDPGYYDFDYTKTKVFRKEASGTVTYTIIFDEAANKQLRFTWEATSTGEIRFSNYQYKMPDNQVVTLTHELKKVAADEDSGY